MLLLVFTKLFIVGWLMKNLIIIGEFKCTVFPIQMYKKV